MRHAPLLVSAILLSASCAQDPALGLRVELDALRAEISELRVEVTTLRNDLGGLPRRDEHGRIGVAAKSLPRPSPYREPTSITVSPELAQALRAASPQELQELARVIPHRDERNRIDGVRLSGVTRDGVLHALGLRSGDILHEIDDHPIRGPADSPVLNEILTASKRSRILLTRRGELMRLVIDMP